MEKHVTNGRKVVDEEEQELSLAIADETDEDISPLQQRPGDVSGWPTNGFHQGKFGTKPSQRLLLQTGAVAAYSERNNAVVMQSPEGASTEGNFDREVSYFTVILPIAFSLYFGNYKCYFFSFRLNCYSI